MATNKTEQFIEKARLVHGDTYDYSKVEYVNCSTKIIIICKEHGEFEQNARSHYIGMGCRKCAYNFISQKNRSSKEEFIQKAINIYGDKFNYSKVNYIKAAIKVIIICRDHGEFEQIPMSHLLGMNGCKKCNYNDYDTKSFIEESIKIHANKYDYSKSIYIDSKTPITIICKMHGEFKHVANVHLRPTGCGKCSKSCKSNTKEFIDKAIQIYGDTYDYSKVEYIKAIDKVIIICKKHGEFLLSPNSHLRGVNCAKCVGGVRLSLIEFIEKAKKTHGNKYDYSKVEYIRSIDKVIIICKKHGEFKQSPSCHLDGNGCQKCANKGFSKAQIEWLSLLEKLYNIKIQHAMNDGEHRIKSTKWKTDGYCKETNTVFEYHGDYWHGNPNRYDPEYMNTVCKRKMKTLYANTINREQKIRDLGYNLEVMWESDWNKINRSIRLIQRAFRSKN